MLSKKQTGGIWYVANRTYIDILYCNSYRFMCACNDISVEQLILNAYWILNTWMFWIHLATSERPSSVGTAVNTQTDRIPVSNNQSQTGDETNPSSTVQVVSSISSQAHDPPPFHAVRLPPIGLNASRAQNQNRNHARTDRGTHGRRPLPRRTESGASQPPSYEEALEMPGVRRNMTTERTSTVSNDVPECSSAIKSYTF